MHTLYLPYTRTSSSQENKKTFFGRGACIRRARGPACRWEHPIRCEYCNLTGGRQQLIGEEEKCHLRVCLLFAERFSEQE